MVKIKRNVEKTLPELIEWAMTTQKHEVDHMYSSENVSVYFNDEGEPRILCIFHFIPSYEKFTVEIEEEIDENTVFKHLYEYTDVEGFYTYEDVSIAQTKDYYSKEFWIKDGDNMTLLWKDGAMVDD